MNPLRAVLLAFLLGAAALPLSATTWYVRADGGTRYSPKVPNGQCDGSADARYSGSGTNRRCAFNDFRYLYDDGTIGNWGWVIAGGDTVVIEGCAAGAGRIHPDAPHCRIGWDDNAGNSMSNPWCWYAPGSYGSNFGCFNPPIPAGTSANHTKIYGVCVINHNCSMGNTTNRGNLVQLFGGFGTQFMLNLSKTQYVDIEGLELTAHNGRCIHYGYPAYPKSCSNVIPGADDYSDNGVLTDNTTAYITLQDLYIHGFAGRGLQGPIGGPITMTRVFVGFNGFAGWDFDKDHVPDGSGSAIAASYVTMEGNGCVEEYPIVNTQFPALTCYDDSSGGFGDSWSGQDTLLATFTCDHCVMIYNTKDGFIGPHVGISYLKITNSQSYGNMGQQWKWAGALNATTIFENNLTVGNCRRMSELLPGARPGFNRNLSDFCRAAGDVFSFNAAANSTVLFVNNSSVGYSATMFDLACQRPNACNSTHFTFRNNIVLGYLNPRSNPPELPGIFYFSDPSIKLEEDHDLFFNLRSKPCPTFGRPDLICDSPAFVNQPPLQVTSEGQLDHFNFHPRRGSPADGRGQTVNGIAADFFGVPRPNPPSIGAVEPDR